MTKDKALKLVRDWIAERPADRPVSAGKMISIIDRALAQPAQEPVACAVCNKVHAILDADESKIIRNAKDGYPDGRAPRILTLQERVTALCVYASDWKRWCLEKENTTPPAAQPEERNFCPRCGKRTADLTTIHTCTPPRGQA